jgi:hypothetical protein
MLLQIQIASESNASELLFDVAPNSWVHKSQGHRTFFADGLAYLPSETPAALQEWRQAELDEMKVCAWASIPGMCGEPPGAVNLCLQLESKAVYDTLVACKLGFERTGQAAMTAKVPREWGAAQFTVMDQAPFVQTGPVLHCSG